jgi:hypothetical protein
MKLQLVPAVVWRMVVIMSPAKPPLPQAFWSVSEPIFFAFDSAENANFSMNAPAQFQYIPGARRPSCNCKWTGPYDSGLTSPSSR